jgi:hypothetical protein
MDIRGKVKKKDRLTRQRRVKAKAEVEKKVRS